MVALPIYLLPMMASYSVVTNASQTGGLCMEGMWGAWIAKWSSHTTKNEHRYAAPWAVRLILGDNYSFSAQA